MVYCATDLEMGFKEDVIAAMTYQMTDVRMRAMAYVP